MNLDTCEIQSFVNLDTLRGPCSVNHDINRLHISDIQRTMIRES